MIGKAYLKDFRGGIAYRAADVAPTTARTWPINIGSRIGDGHKRYDLIDVVALKLMSHLTADHGIAAAHAAAAVNSARAAMLSETERHLAEQAKKKEWRWDGGPFLAMLPKRNDGRVGLTEIVDEAEIATYLAAAANTAVVVVALPRLINAAQLSLENVHAGMKPAFDVE